MADRAATLEEIGSALRVTGQRVRIIEAAALRKLRHPSRTRVLREYAEHLDAVESDQLAYWWAGGSDGRGNKWAQPKRRCP